MALHNKKAVGATGPSGKVRVFQSQSAASRLLSGTGSDRLQRRISAAMARGGDYVGKTFVEQA